jgi:hypothetical protein
MEQHKTWLFILFFIIFIIVLLIASYKNFMEKKEGFKEGIDWPKIPSPQEIGDRMRADFDRIGDKAREVGDKMKGGFNEIGDKIGGVFKDIIERFKKIGYGFDNIFKGIGDEFVGLGEGLRLGFDDIGSLFEYTGEFLLTYTMCGVKFVSNIASCFFYYMVDTILQIFYLPVRIFLFILWFIYPGVYKIETLFWKQVHKLDNLNYKYTHIYFTRWPKEIRDLCYNCKRLKVQVLKRKAQDVDDDFNIKMPQLLKKGVDRMKKGGDELLGAFR